MPLIRRGAKAPFQVRDFLRFLDTGVEGEGLGSYGWRARVVWQQKTLVYYGEVGY